MNTYSHQQQAVVQLKTEDVKMQNEYMRKKIQSQHRGEQYDKIIIWLKVGQILFSVYLSSCNLEYNTA